MESKSKTYSLANLIFALDSADKKALDSLELRLSREVLEPEAQRPARLGGAFIPLRPTASGLDGKTNAAGGYLEQVTLGDQIIAAVRAQSHVLSLGAQSLTPRAGSLQIPVAESGNQCYWQTENFGADAGQVDAVFSARWMAPHALITSWCVSRQLLGQARSDLEQFLLNDISRAIAAEVDRVAITGSGEQGEPVGLLNPAVKVPVISIAQDGGHPLADTIDQMEESVGLGNFTPTGWVTTPSIRRRLRRTPSIDSTYASIPLWSDDADDPGGSSMLGYAARCSTNVPSHLVKGNSSNCHAIIHGDFSQIVVPVWDFEIVKDPFTKKKQGLVELTVYTSLDIGVIRPNAFALCLDAVA